MAKKSKSRAHLFQKGKSGNVKGRARKLTHEIIATMKKDGLEPLRAMQVVDAYEVLLNCTIPELTKAASDDSMPMFIRIIAKALVNSKGTEALEKILDRAHGKAAQQITVTEVPPEEPKFDLSKLSKEDLDTYYALTEKIRN